MHYKICIVGAGVIGLTTAVNVQTTIPNAHVTIIADKLTTETLSDGAAGIFRPSNSIRGPEENSLKTWIRDSYEFYEHIARTCSEDAGIKEISGHLLSKKFKDVTQSPLLEDLLLVWQTLNENELQQFPGNWKYGVHFKTLLIECRRFLPWLTKRFLEDGGSVCKKHIDSFEELIGHFDIVVNCTGFAAKQLCNDHKIVPIRGQVIKVKAPWVKNFYYGDYDTYIIPGFDTITLGGTRQFDSFNEEEDPYDSQSIWERCCALLPSLKNAEVVRKFVGLRPHRDPVRLEKQEVTFGNKRLTIVHNYGHGGYGITLAWGCARNAARLVETALKEKQFIHNKL